MKLTKPKKPQNPRKKKSREAQKKRVRETPNGLGVVEHLAGADRAGERIRIQTHTSANPLKGGYHDERVVKPQKVVINCRRFQSCKNTGHSRGMNFWEKTFTYLSFPHERGALNGRAEWIGQGREKVDQQRTGKKKEQSGEQSIYPGPVIFASSNRVQEVPKKRKSTEWDGVGSVNGSVIPGLIYVQGSTRAET